MNLVRHVATVAAILYSSLGFAAESLTPEPDGSAYHFVSHYSVNIAAD